MYWLKLISFDCKEYCLGLINRRKLLEDEIYILFVYYYNFLEKFFFSSFIVFICLFLGEKVNLRNLRYINFF